MKLCQNVCCLLRDTGLADSELRHVLYIESVEKPPRKAVLAAVPLLKSKGATSKKNFSYSTADIYSELAKFSH